MATEANYKEIENILKDMPCPKCGIKPSEVGVNRHIFALTVNCDHDEFLSELSGAHSDYFKKLPRITS